MNLLNLFQLLYGACFGSFINVVVFRFPRGLSVILKRSFCFKCQREIPWFDNIPVLSFLILKGKCRFCSKRISLQYPILEILTALLFNLNIYAKPSIINSTSEIYIALYGSILLCFLIPLVIIDIRHMWLPKSLNYIGILTGSIIISIDYFLSDMSSNTILKSFCGGILGISSFYLISIISKLILKKDGLGLGDAKLAGLLGIWLGSVGFSITFFLSFTSSAFFSIILLSLNKIKTGQPFPFGPFLALSGYLVWLFGNEFWISKLEIISSYIYSL